MLSELAALALASLDQGADKYGFILLHCILRTCLRELYLCNELSLACCSLTRLTCLECETDDSSAVQPSQFLSASLRELKLAGVTITLPSLESMLQGFQGLTCLRLVECEQRLTEEDCLVLPPAVR